jgi:hypothetical protein
MLKLCAVIAMMVAMAMPAFAAKKIAGTTTLKDSQPLGLADKKHKQHQAYDLSFDAAGKEYTCRTNPKKSMNATDFVVGGMVSYEVDGSKGKIQTAEGKKVECTIVRVEMVGASSPAAPQ